MDIVIDGSLLVKPCSPTLARGSNMVADVTVTQSWPQYQNFSKRSHESSLPIKMAIIVDGMGNES